MAQRQDARRDSMNVSAVGKVSGCDRCDYLRVDLLVRARSNVGPNFGMVHDDAIVEHTHTVSNYRLIVGKSVGDEAAVTNHSPTLSPLRSAQESGDRVIGTIDPPQARPKAKKTARVAPALLGVHG